jgi:hypothetical protein
MAQTGNGKRNVAATSAWLFGWLSRRKSSGGYHYGYRRNGCHYNRLSSKILIIWPAHRLFRNIGWPESNGSYANLAYSGERKLLSMANPFGCPAESGSQPAYKCLAKAIKR